VEATFWGVRGDVPVSSTYSEYFGGDTACVEVILDGGELLIFDGGTGLIRLGRRLPDQGEAHLFLTCGQLCRWQGLPHFRPLSRPGWTIHLHYPATFAEVPDLIFDPRYFPQTNPRPQARVTLNPLKPGHSLTIGAARIIARAADSPDGALDYHLRDNTGAFLYTAGIFSRADRAAMAVSGTGLTVIEPPDHFGEDLEALSQWVDEAAGQLKGALVLSRHHLDLADGDLEAWRRQLVEISNQRRTVAVAYAGLRLKVGSGLIEAPKGDDWLQELRDTLSHYRDENVILDLILYKSREMTRAEAGTVYIVDGEELVFAYAHNDHLFPADLAYKYSYINLRLPISRKSLTGYVATTGEALNLADVHHLPPGAPYQFDDSFDRRTGYNTVTALTLPIVSRSGRLLGVLQLLNSRDPAGAPRPFTRQMENRVSLLAQEAAITLELTSNIRRGIFRLMRIASLHDPAETGPHAERVGAIAAEIYQCWADQRQVAPEQIRYYKSQLRLAGMLHDIGKVGISDVILKKSGPLDQIERETMRSHTFLGSSLFAQDNNDITELATEVTLHHHQCWDGSGYSGDPALPALAGENIPLAARMTAIADVFDALVSRRCYKKTWTFAEAVEYVKKESGRHFDPTLTECFLEILPLVTKIYQRFPDEEPESED